LRIADCGLRIERRETAGLLLSAICLWLFAAPSAVAMQPPQFTPDQMGGTLRANMNAEPRLLNPLISKDLYSRFVQDRVLESLIERDYDTLEWKPQLADRWLVSPDGLTITFHLDPRARFSDGRPMTADDVLFTYETSVNPKIDCRDLASYYEDCQMCEKVDERTVRFIWKKPYFKSLEFSALTVIPKHVYEFKDPKTFNDITDHMVGSGPYVLKEWKTGQHLVLVRNENYWGRPVAIDRIVYRFILEEQPSVQALLAGELDELPVTPEWWVKLRQDPQTVARFQWFRYSTPFNGYGYIGWNNARPPFDDPRVRRAMSHLVWREQILKYMWHDIGTVTTGPFWPESPQNDASIKPVPFDREAARALLKEAGWEDRDGDGWLENAEGKRFTFELAFPAGHQESRDFVRILQEEFRRMGIDMNQRASTWAVFTVKLDTHDFDAVRLGWGGGGVESDPYQIWHSSQIADQGSNFISFRSAEADRLMELARATMDEAKRNTLFHQFHRVIHQEQPYTFLWSPESLRILSPRVKGVQVHKLGMDWREWWIGKDEAGEAPPAPPATGAVGLLTHRAQVSTAGQAGRGTPAAPATPQAGPEAAR
jgi:peptide/nickel transport system substrate-binding protein